MLIHRQSEHMGTTAAMVADSVRVILPVVCCCLCRTPKAYRARYQRKSLPEKIISPATSRLHLQGLMPPTCTTLGFTRHPKVTRNDVTPSPTNPHRENKQRENKRQTETQTDRQTDR